MLRKKRSEGTRASNGAASIYQGADGYWYGRVTMGVRDDGRADRRHVSGKTETEVLQKTRALEKDRDAGRTKKPGRAWIVEKWLTHWLENIAAASVRPKTYAGISDRRPAPSDSGYRGAPHLSIPAGAHREAVHREAGEEPQACDGPRVHRTLRTAFNGAVRRGQLVKNPALHAKAPRLVEEKIEPFTVEEAQRVLEAAAVRRNGVRHALALALGLRQGEALGLQCDLDDNAGTLAIRRAIQRHIWRHGCGNTCAALVSSG